MTDLTSAEGAALERIRAYREQLDRADRTADQNSLDRAADLELLYLSFTWVDDLPAPKRQAYRGRPVDPRSWNRFGSWVHLQTGLHPSRVAQLHRAHELVGIISTRVQVIPTGEYALRPLARLKRAGYGDRIPDIYETAVKLADGPPGPAETKQAVRDFLAQWSPQQRRERSVAERARSHRLKAQTAVEIMIRDGIPDEVEAFRQWFTRRVSS